MQGNNKPTGTYAGPGAIRLLVSLCLLLVMSATGCKSHDPRDVSDPTLRVMSFNVRVHNFGDTILGNGWNSRKGDVVHVIKEYDPDLLGTQEGKSNQVSYIRKKLKWYGMHGAGRDNGRSGGEYCAIYYRLIRFTPQERGHIWFNDSGRPGRRTWGSVFPRMASWILLYDKFTGETVLAVNTHFDVISSESRERSARMLRELIDEYPAAYVVLTGDFNCDVGSEPFRILTGGRSIKAQRRLIDTYTAAGHKDGRKDGRKDGTRHGFHIGDKGGDRIDWILVSPEVKVVRADIVHDKPLLDGYPSDHYPVTADVLLPAGSGE